MAREASHGDLGPDEESHAALSDLERQNPSHGSVVRQTDTERFGQVDDRRGSIALPVTGDGVVFNCAHVPGIETQEKRAKRAARQHEML